MKFNFRKITSVLASAVMLGSTAGFAAAAMNYPAPFIAGGNADVAVVVGASSAVSDYFAALDIGSNLATELAKQTATPGTGSTGNIQGESAPLFSGSSKVYINDSLNNVKSVVTKATNELPTTLKDETFSGNVDAKYTQTIAVGNTPQITFAKQPTSSDDPLYALTTSSSSGNHIYNATIDFNKAVNFTHADSKNQELILFGQKFTVGAATDGTNLVLLKSATKINLDSGGTTSEEVTIDGKKYTVEMVSASTTTATIKVTNEAGATDQKEITEGFSKKVNGITVSVTTADSNNLKYTASVVAGAEKITLTSGSAITVGESDTVVDGTLATFTGGTTAMTKLIVSIRAPSSDKDAVKPGTSFVDPVFGSFKLDFPSLSITDDSTTAREDIKVKASGDDKMVLEMTDMRGNTKSFQFAINATNTINLQWDTDGHNIHVAEMEAANKSDYIVVGNEDEGRLIKVYQIVNQTTGYSNDKVTFQDIFSGDTTDATLTAEGSGTVTIGGKVYTVTYTGASDTSDDARQVRLNYPDSTGNDILIFPTIQSSKGAKVFLYKALTVNLGSYDGAGGVVSNIKVPNGADSYQSVAIAAVGGAGTTFNVSGVILGSAANATAVAITNTGFTLNFTYGGINQTTVYLFANDPNDNANGGPNIADPAIGIFEEKDYNNLYHGLIVTLEPGRTGDDGIGVNAVVRTWQNDATWEAIALASDSKKTKEGDRWGSIALLDSSDSDQKSATVSYPDEQVYAPLYIGATGSSITGTSTSAGNAKELGNPAVYDTEVTSVSGKNLIVIGGSCVNKAAAKMLGSETPLCGADFTEKTTVGADQFIVKVMESPYSSDKIAMLVAGYEAADTTKAVVYVRTMKPATDKGTEVIKKTVEVVA